MTAPRTSAASTAAAAAIASPAANTTAAADRSVANDTLRTPENATRAPHTLVEHVADWRPADLRIDRDSRTIANVALTGSTSRNGYRYAERALREAVALYADKPVFLDHAGDATRPRERSTRDLVGSIVAPRFVEGRIRGDIRVLDTEAGRTFLALVAAGAPAVGMSHVVIAEQSPDRTTVERIREVISVDAVAFPATTSSLREGTAGPCAAPQGAAAGRANAGERGTAAQPATGARRSSRSARPVEQRGATTSDGPREPVGANASHGADASGGTTESDLRRECERLREVLAELEAEKRRLETEQESAARRVRIAERIAAAGLPAEAVTECFVEQLLAAPDESARRVLLDDRRALVEQVRAGRPESVERREGGASGPCDADFVSAIRGGRRALRA